MMEDFQTNSHTDELKQMEEIKQNLNKIKNKESSHFIKNFILKWGRQIVDLMALIQIIGVFILFIAIIAGYTYSFYIGKEYYYNDNYFVLCTVIFIVSLLIPLIMLIVTIMSNYLTYLFIDIRDSLKNISKNKNL
jgi:hypothetical protein